MFFIMIITRMVKIKMYLHVASNMKFKLKKTSECLTLPAFAYNF